MTTLYDRLRHDLELARDTAREAAEEAHRVDNVLQAVRESASARAYTHALQLLEAAAGEEGRESPA